MKRKYVVVTTCAGLVSVPVVLATGALLAALPPLDGKLPGRGLHGPASIHRDPLGIPTVRAADRTDLAYATGFAHGQDRFFQMDFSRKLAAGELSEVAGAMAVNQDKAARIFRFRHIAEQVVAQSSPEQRAILAAYAAGVNAGLATLRARPWEYWLLRSKPQEWRSEDSVLVILAMWWDLQYRDFQRDMLRTEINAKLQGPLCDFSWKCSLAFFYPARTTWDAPVDAPADAATVEETSAGIPGREILDVRGTSRSSELANSPVRAPAIGSNSWAVAGRLTNTGAALVANDMHLGLRVPTTWYRARLQIADASGAVSLDLNGVTLPGTPLLIAGSNGHIAWGFTNSFGKWLQANFVPCTSVSDNRVTTASGSQPVETEWEFIRVHGQASVPLPIRSGPQGVLLKANPELNQCWFAQWLAQRPDATNMNLMALERVTTVGEALALGPEVGIPQQNFVVGDQAGHIGWTVYGHIPAAPELSAPWTTPQTHPHLLDPDIGRIWTANARVTNNPQAESTIGGNETSLGAEYYLGARARQIRDDLLALPGRAAPADMLAIQLDDRAVFLTRWRDLLVRLLDEGGLAADPERARIRDLVAGWSGHAGIDSVGYRLVRAYRDQTAAAVWKMMLDAMGVQPPKGAEMPPQFEEPLWRLVNEQPLHMLSKRYSSWHEFMLSELEKTVADLRVTCGKLTECTWGAQNTVRVRHPLSKALPFLSWLLDMPGFPLPGDDDMPRVQQGGVGASERFAVSPGHEAQGYFELAGGQSGNPLSSYYKAGFTAWARGEQLPFLPGSSQHTLLLKPE